MLPARARRSAAAGGTTDGVTGGVAGGTGNGSSVVARPKDHGPFRVGNGIARPRKIKDVSLSILSPPWRRDRRQRAHRGHDRGRRQSARRARAPSVALFDQAALDAVRQWEFEPSRLNGEAVAVKMVIVVTFSLL